MPMPEWLRLRRAGPVPADQAAQACQIAEDLGIGACIAGTVEDGPKQLLIEPLNIRFGDDDLQLR